MKRKGSVCYISDLVAAIENAEVILSQILKEKELQSLSEFASAF
jgi:hypothetical protein